MRWLVVLLVACGGIDPEQAEAKVKEIAEASTHAKVASVDCPKAERKTGVQFQCQVTFTEGGQLAMVVTVTDADNGTFEPKWAAPSVVSKKHLGEMMSKHEQDDYDCGAGVVAAPADIDCKGPERTVTVHIDENGDAHW